MIEVEIDAGSKTANFSIVTVQDNEYEQGQQFNVSVVSVKHDHKDVFEQLDTSSANKDVAIVTDFNRRVICTLDWFFSELFRN